MIDRGYGSRTGAGTVIPKFTVPELEWEFIRFNWFQNWNWNCNREWILEQHYIQTNLIRISWHINLTDAYI